VHFDVGLGFVVGDDGPGLREGGREGAREGGREGGREGWLSRWGEM